MPLRIESEFFETSDSRRITFALGTDFPPGSQGAWHHFVYLLRDTGVARGDAEVLERYFGFAEIAADPDVEANLAKGRGPFFYPVGRLFGHTDRSLREEFTLLETGNEKHGRDWTYRRKHAAELNRQGAAWRQIMRLESNPATTYMSPCDAAPVYVMTKTQVSVRGYRAGWSMDWRPNRAISR